MHCDFERVEALLRGELHGEARAETLSHIENCPECKQYYRHLFTLEGTEEVSADFHNRVMAQVRQTPQKRVSRRSVWQAVAGIAACLAIVVAAGMGDGLMMPSGGPSVARSGIISCPADVRLVIEEAQVQEVRTWLQQEGISCDRSAKEELYALSEAQTAALATAFPGIEVPQGIVFVVLPME